jgi:hypothetical protein
MGIMGVDREPAELEAQQRERAARKEREQRERRHAQKRAEMIREGRERPDNEFLGLGVVIHDDDVLVWSTSVTRPWSANRRADWDRWPYQDPRCRHRGGRHRSLRDVGRGWRYSCPRRPAVRVHGVPDETLHQHELTTSGSRPTREVGGYRASGVEAEVPASTGPGNDCTKLSPERALNYKGRARQ